MSPCPLRTRQPHWNPSNILPIFQIRRNGWEQRHNAKRRDFQAPTSSTLSAPSWAIGLLLWEPSVPATNICPTDVHSIFTSVALHNFHLSKSIFLKSCSTLYWSTDSLQTKPARRNEHLKLLAGIKISVVCMQFNVAQLEFEMFSTATPCIEFKKER